MSKDNAWTDEWLKAQQKFVESWSDMTKGWHQPEHQDQSNLWANGLDMWRKTYPYPYPTQPETDQVINKCMDIGKGYFSMAEQIGKQVSAGSKPEEVINQWLEQLKRTLQQQADHWSPTQHQTSNDFMSQWMNPSASWQKMASAMMPKMPGLSPAGFGIGEEFNQLNQTLSMPGIGFFRESQEKQQAGIKLMMEYQQANNQFNQATLRVSIESLQLFQQKLSDLKDNETTQPPTTLRGLYDLWVEVSETCYADFAMSNEYQTLYGDMVNRLMALKKHYNEMLDETMSSLNLPSRKEMDTVQQRLQETRRDNHALRRELKEIRSLLTGKKPATQPKQAEVKPVKAEQAEPKKAAVKKPSVKKAVAKKTAPTKKASSKPRAKPEAGV